MRRLSVPLAGLVLAALCVPVAARAAAPATSQQQLDTLVANGPGCDPIDPARCMLPFPDDFYSVADRSTATGRRIKFSLTGMPTNVAGVPADPTAWNQADGFSPGSAILTLVPGLDLNRTWGTVKLPPRERDNLADLSRYLELDSPFVVIDAANGKRQPLWSEMDSRRGVAAGERLVILHPAVNFLEGHNYVVALRGMRNADGALIAPSPAYAAYRDRRPAPPGAPASFAGRRPAMERDFRVLEGAGIARRDLYLSWDFTVASEQSLAATELHIRNDAFASLGDRNLGDRKITGRPPAYKITSVTNFTTQQDPITGRRVSGTIDVPNYLTPQAQVDVATPNGLPSPLGGIDQPLAVPGSHLNYLGSTDGYPVRDPLQPDLQVTFVCDIPRSAWGAPSHPSLYGHGLLGSQDEVNGGSDTQLRLHNFTTCATDWAGFASEDLPNVATVLADIGNFSSVTERAQQGFLNFMFLGRALAHPDGLVASPAFRTDAGRPLIQTSQLYYDGNSQGGIMGGALTALDPDLIRSVLGVTGMNYSLLLDRSVDWVDEYYAVYKAAYPDPIDQELGYDLLQMLWDRAEADGYAQHMTSSPYPDTPAHQVLMEVAFGDHQVSNIAAEVEARTIGARLKVPSLAAGLHWSVDPSFGLATAGGFPASGGSYLVYWNATDEHDVTPPTINVPDVVGHDPHEDPRRDYAAGDQEARFLLTGQLIDTCRGAPCVTVKATRSG